MLIDKPNKVLPSDCQFREDLIWRKMNNFDKGQVMSHFKYQSNPPIGNERSIGRKAKSR